MYIYIYIDIYICMYICMYVCIHVDVYRYIYICKSILISIYRFRYLYLFLYLGLTRYLPRFVLFFQFAWSCAYLPADNSQTANASVCDLTAPPVTACAWAVSSGSLSPQHRYSFSVTVSSETGESLTPCIYIYILFIYTYINIC